MRRDACHCNFSQWNDERDCGKYPHRKSRNAKVIFITANPAPETAARCDEVLRVAYLKNLDTGTKISPQFSILVMIDILYSYYFANDSYFKAQKYKETLSAIQGKHKGAMEDAEKGEDPE